MVSGVRCQMTDVRIQSAEAVIVFSYEQFVSGCWIFDPFSQYREPKAESLIPQTIHLKPVSVHRYNSEFYQSHNLPLTPDT